MTASHNWIDLTLPVAQTLQAHPELKELLIDLGFKPLANPLMLKTVGTITSLERGAGLIGLPLDDLIQQLHWNGYRVKGVDSDDGFPT